MVQFGDWPYMADNVVNIVNTPVITPSDSQLVAAEWSSRCDLPIPVREDTVELRVRPSEPTQPVTLQVRLIVLPSDTNESSDDDDVHDDERYQWHIKPLPFMDAILYLPHKSNCNY
jgi:hypothetical protein